MMSNMFCCTMFGTAFLCDFSKQVFRFREAGEVRKNGFTVSGFTKIYKNIVVNFSNLINYSKSKKPFTKAA